MYIENTTRNAIERAGIVFGPRRTTEVPDDMADSQKWPEIKACVHLRVVEGDDVDEDEVEDQTESRPHVDAGPQEGSDLEAPPRTGTGSGKANWEDFVKDHPAVDADDFDLDDMTKTEIIDALEAEGVIEPVDGSE